MIGHIYDLCEMMHLQGIYLHLVCAFILTLIFTTFVLLVGYMVNRIEIFQMQVMMKFMPRKAALFFCNYLTGLGTIIHESSHALMAWSTGAKITELRLFEISKSGRLGHVGFRPVGSKLKQAWQMAMTACAPTLNGLLWCYILVRVLMLYQLPVEWTVFLVYLLISIFDHMSMSEQDIRSYFKGLFVVFPVMMFVMFVFVYLYAARVRTAV